MRFSAERRAERCRQDRELAVPARHWTCSHGWPPAFRGDPSYWMVDHDLREGAGTVDTSRVGVHLLTGEYDDATSSAHGRAAHVAIPGSTFTVMEGMGDFPMSEDPARFLEHLRTVLERIEAAG